ncbi:MAG: glycine zipper 2TM domain-containing protein [Thiobacillaceae bacterium]
MKFRPIVIALATVMGLGAASAQADYRPGFPDKARVISSTPVYDRINEPRQQCWTETVGYDEEVYRSRNDNGGAILGAITGGLLGSTVGRGAGRVAGAAIGAATGAVIGDRIDGDDHYYRRARPRQVEHCQVSDSFRDVVVGYDVVYSYHGQQYSTRMANDPGRWLDVNVEVSPGRQTPYFRNPYYED